MGSAASSQGSSHDLGTKVSHSARRLCRLAETQHVERDSPLRGHFERIWAWMWKLDIKHPEEGIFCACPAPVKGL